MGAMGEDSSQVDILEHENWFKRRQGTRAEEQSRLKVKFTY